MHFVIVASKSFGHGAERSQLDALFRRHDLEPLFTPLKDAGSALTLAHGLIIGTERVTRSALEEARSLRAIVKYGVGMDNIDAGAARELGVEIRNLPGVNATTVAEMALGLMLAVARRIPAGDRCVRAGEWDGLIGTDVIGKTLGIVGTGAIGCALAGLVSGLRMKVLGSDPVKNPDFLAAGGNYVPLDGLLESADFVSLHLPLNEETTRMVDAGMLARMRRGAILINTSRGKVVDQHALMQALASGRLRGAALDVFEQEPPSPEDLRTSGDAVYTPHIGAYTEETLRRMDEACVAALSGALGPGRGAAR